MNIFNEWLNFSVSRHVNFAKLIKWPCWWFELRTAVICIMIRCSSKEFPDLRYLCISLNLQNIWSSSSAWVLILCVGRLILGEGSLSVEWSLNLVIHHRLLVTHLYWNHLQSRYFSLVYWLYLGQWKTSYRVIVIAIPGWSVNASKNDWLFKCPPSTHQIFPEIGIPIDSMVLKVYQFVSKFFSKLNHQSSLEPIPIAW